MKLDDYFLQVPDYRYLSEVGQYERLSQREQDQQHGKIDPRQHADNAAPPKSRINLNKPDVAPNVALQLHAAHTLQMEHSSHS